MKSVYIVDDEALAIKRLIKKLQPFVENNQLEIVGSNTDSQDALAWLNQQKVDVLFLDIRMPELDGFGLIERLNPEMRPKIIFTTAFDEYALKAFRMNAIDYLVKPIVTEELDEAISRLETIEASAQNIDGFDQDKISQLLDWLDENELNTLPNLKKGSYAKQLSIPHRDRYLIINVNQIVSIEVQDSITRFYVHTEDKHGEKLSRYIVNYTLDELEEKLDPDKFLRVHRSSIINLNHINEMITWFSGRYKLVLTANHEVIASRERSKILRKRLSL